MFQRVLVAVDGSEHSIRALEAGARIAKADDAGLTVVTVAYVPPLYKVDLNSELLQSFRDSGRMILDDARKVLDRAGIEAETRLVEDIKPAEAIAQLARTEEFDLVVLGRRGLSDSTVRRPGGVSGAVLHEVGCSVMLVH